MAGRGPQTFQKRQKEQQRKEKQQEKIAKRLARKQNGGIDPDANDDDAIEGEEGLRSAEESEPETAAETPETPQSASSVIP